MRQIQDAQSAGKTKLRTTEHNGFFLPEGDYRFQVESFKRAHHPGSGKLPSCPKAVLHIRINAPEGSCTITHNLFLFTTMEWKLSEFFRSIGQKQHGEKLRMNWSAVPGAAYQCKIGIHKFTKKTVQRENQTRL